MKEKLFRRTSFQTVILTLAVTAPLLFNSCRPSWVFINNTVGIPFFTTALLIAMVITACAVTATVSIGLYGKNTSFYNKKAYSVLSLIFSVLAVILFIFAFVYIIGLIFSESREVTLLYIKDTLCDALYILPVSLLAVFLPCLSCKGKRIVCAAVIIAVSLFAVNDFFPLSPYKITSEPTVIDNGKEYSVVFSTSDEGTGYIEYTYQGEDYRVFDNIGGRIRSDSKIHSVSVPYEHLKNNSYKIGSVRVIEDYSYGSRVGKEVTSDNYTLTVNETDEQTYLVISDWHTMLSEAYTAIENLSSDYDAVILLGDSTPGVDFEEQVISNTVQFGGRVSKGEKPVIYVRGNHETRGIYAGKIPQSLGIDEFYYTTHIGPYSFVVLDSGEDKDDSHSEYGGMTDYNTYRKNMIEWLEDTEVKSKKVITLSHAWQISEVEEELSEKGWQEIDRLGTRLIISGHIHQCRLLGEGSEREKAVFSKYPHIIGYADGGKSGKNYTASLMTLTKDKISIRAVNNLGQQQLSESFSW